MKKLIIAFALCIPFASMAQIADSSQRKVKLQGAINFRDLGGYKTQDGHMVKWSRVYRSAAINHLTDADMMVFSKRQIKTVIDFRGTQESAIAEDRLLPNSDYILCPAGSEHTLDWMKSLSTVKSGDSLMQTFYSQTDAFTDRYRPFFQKLLALPDSSALLFHCTAGKDRTGIGAALFLYALGVPFSTIMQDYEATNYYRAQENEKMTQGMAQQMHISEQVAKDMASAKANYLQATFDAITKKYGSVDKFMSEELGMNAANIQKLRDKYLQKA
ncbi:tyrosine-protein phosphatase [Taibaiella soli]|uniref:Protein-tyrosine-phosphatase n=1 Tax=Taibaiella soli TaxID=1649169 RepID=A0A2W2AT91_9BACT|nr:tyrosine-protein phosphatase [Taibaiella soli]PZF70918.1 protein-tyrosine-phosphatase [Taibaiella soli]